VNTDLPERLLEVARRAAAAAARELRPRFGGPATGVSAKSSHTDLVSDADRAAETAIREVLDAARPEDALVAEEGAAAEGTSGVRWIVDPLDGTINFLWGIPHWAVSIAAVGPDGPLAAVVLDPCRDECFAAGRGLGAWLGDRRMRMAPPADLSEALIGTGFNYTADERARQAALMPDILPRVRDIRRFGAAALDLAWVAAGRLDGFIERGLQEWDWAAGALLVTEAGGRVELLESAPPRPDGVAAAHPALLADLRALFGEAV